MALPDILPFFVIALYFLGTALYVLGSALRNERVKVTALTLAGAGFALHAADLVLMLGQEGVTSKQECFIVTSDKGRRLFMKALRNSNQILLGDRQDPRYNKPRYDGWKIINVKTLNQATLYPASAGQASEDGATTTAGGTITNTGPRFYFINPKALTYFFHKDGYFKKMDSLKHPNKILECHALWQRDLDLPLGLLFNFKISNQSISRGGG